MRKLAATPINANDRIGGGGGFGAIFRRPRNMERKNIGTLTGNDALPCVSARRITLPFPFTVIFTTRRVTLCMIVERSRRGSIILFQPTLYIPLFLPIIYNISRAPPFFREPCGFFRTGFEQPPRNLASKSRLDEETGVETSRFSLLLDHFPYTYVYNYFLFFFFYVLDLLGRKETRDRELSPLGRLERSKGGE